MDGGGSVGPVIGVVIVIVVLGLMAGVVGRLCSGRSVMGRGNYDFEGWVERKCSDCIDGRVDPPQPHHRAAHPPPRPQVVVEADVEESPIESSDESGPETETKPQQKRPGTVEDEAQLRHHQQQQQQHQQQEQLRKHHQIPQQHQPQMQHQPPLQHQQQHSSRHHHHHHYRNEDRPESSQARQSM